MCPAVHCKVSQLINGEMHGFGRTSKAIEFTFHPSEKPTGKTIRINLTESQLRAWHRFADATETRGRVVVAVFPRRKTVQITDFYPFGESQRAPKRIGIGAQVEKAVFSHLATRFPGHLVEEDLSPSPERVGQNRAMGIDSEKRYTVRKRLAQVKRYLATKTR